MNREDTVKLYRNAKQGARKRWQQAKTKTKRTRPQGGIGILGLRRRFLSASILKKRVCGKIRPGLIVSGFSFLAAELDSKAVEDRDDMVESPHNEAARIDGAVIDMRGFIFPGDADFSEAIFAIRTQYDKAWFSNDASFREAKFEGYTSFSGACFS